MKKIPCIAVGVLFSLISLTAVAQMTQDPPSKKAKSKGPKLGLGIKAGLNSTNVTNVKTFNPSPRNGYMIGAFLAPGGFNNIIASRHEIVFSRQNYDFSTNTVSGSVNLSYILMPNFFCINVTKYVQLQAGLQIAYLLNARADSTSDAGSGPYSGVSNYYNKFAYSLAGGVEIHPFKGILLGLRYNVGLNNANKTADPSMMMASPVFFPTNGVNFKTNVIQLSVGYIF